MRYEYLWKYMLKEDPTLEYVDDFNNRCDVLIQKAPLDYMGFYLLYYVDNESVKRIAELNNCAITTVWRYINRAKEFLRREYLNKYSKNKPEAYEIYSLGLHRRMENALLGTGVKTIDDIKKMSKSELIGTKYIGRKGYREIMAIIKEM